MSLFGIFLFVKCSDDLWIYTILLNGGQFIGCATMWASLNKYIYFVKPSLKGIKKHIVPNIKLFIPVIAISVYKTMDKIMLGSISTNSQVGFYTNAESLINAPMGFIVAVGTVMLPRITNLLKNDEIEKSKIYFKKSLKLTMCFSCAVAFGLIAVAPTFVPLYYGNGFEDCIFLIQGQAIVMLFLAWANVIRTQFLLPHQHDKQYIYSIIIGACVNVILNLVLIPNYAAAGALIATIFAEGTVCVIQSFDAAKYNDVLLIDCDLRHPSVHKMMKVSNRSGLTNIIAQFQDGLSVNSYEGVQQVIFEGGQNLTLITAGHRVPNPSEVLGSKRMGRFLEQARKEFSYIIIDSPPVAVASDTIPLCNLSDGVLYVVDAKNADKRRVKMAINDLKRNGGNVIGLVMNKVDMSDEKRYGYGYGYGYGEENDGKKE